MRNFGLSSPSSSCLVTSMLMSYPSALKAICKGLALPYGFAAAAGTSRKIRTEPACFAAETDAAPGGPRERADSSADGYHAFGVFRVHFEYAVPGAVAAP